MAVRAPVRERIEETSDVWVSSRAITFDEYLHTYEGVKEHVELVRGVPTTRMSANIPHEMLYAWVFRLLSDYVEWHDLGIVLGSRTAVKITNYDGRLPDILFVRKDRLGILERLNLSAAPDLVIEILSPGDRPSDRMRLEADYRSVGVPEILFVAMGRKRVQMLRKADGDYRADEMRSGTVHFDSLPGFWIDVDWLFAEPRIPVYEALARIQAGPPAA